MDKKKVFMIMPFEDKFFEVYEMLKREFEKDFIFSHAADIVKSIHTVDNEILLSEDTEKGFLDYMAGIEENMD